MECCAGWWFMPGVGRYYVSPVGIVGWFRVRDSISVGVRVEGKWYALERWSFIWWSISVVSDMYVDHRQGQCSIFTHPMFAYTSHTVMKIIGIIVNLLSE